MKKNYVRCPYCNKKTKIDEHICSNCKRLLPSKIEKKSHSFILLILLFLIILVCIMFFYEKDEVIKKENTVQDFSKVIGNISYDSTYNENKLIYVKNDTDGKMVNTKGKVVVDNVSSLEEDCNYFYIITKRENNNKYYYIVDNNGKEIYKDKDKIYYYAKHNVFLIGKDLYYNNQKIASDIVMDNNKVYSGDYFSYNDKSKGGIIDYKGDIKYQTNIDEFLYLESTSKKDMLDKNYCIINKDYEYAVIDCETGDIVINYSIREIEELNNNIYIMNKIVFYIDYNKQLIYYDKEPNEIDYSSRYFINDKLLFGRQLLNIKDGMPYDNVVVSSKVEIDNNIKTTLCKDIDIYYGMSINDSVLPCIYDNVEFFSTRINDYLKDKVYVILNKNNEIILFDIKSNKFINKIENMSLTSPLIVFEDNGRRYIYNLKTDDNKIINDNDKVTIYDNYYVIESLDVDNMISNEYYYGLDLEKIDVK